MVEDLDEEDEQYVLIQSAEEEEGGRVVHPAIESFESCLKQFANLVDMGAMVQDKDSQQDDDIEGTSLRESDQNHLIKFANSVFAECDQLLVNKTSSKQGVAPVVASSIKVTGNIL